MKSEKKQSVQPSLTCTSILQSYYLLNLKCSVLKYNTQQSAGEFLTTDAMKHIVQETKKKFKDCAFLAQKYQIACIDCMFRYYAYKAYCMSSTFFPTISVHIETHVHFFGTMLTQIADSFQLEQDVIDLPKHIASGLSLTWTTLICLSLDLKMCSFLWRTLHRCWEVTQATCLMT